MGGEQAGIEVAGMGTTIVAVMLAGIMFVMFAGLIALFFVMNKNKKQQKDQ